jgi:hypothetical protein
MLKFKSFMSIPHSEIPLDFNLLYLENNGTNLALNRYAKNKGNSSRSQTHKGSLSGP